LDDERPKRRVIESVAKKPLARSRAHEHPGTFSVNKADKYGRQHSGDVYYAVQGDATNSLISYIFVMHLRHAEIEDLR